MITHLTKRFINGLSRMKDYSLPPIVEDFGEGYMVFCPNCLAHIGWLDDYPDLCLFCGQEIKREINNGNT
jgi:hypothetical protein